VWTGDELVVLGGRDVTGEEARDFTDGAAYDPQADTWRSIADLPGEARTGAGIARGDEVVYVVGGDALGAVADGPAEPGVHALAWDPGADTWYELPDPPGTPRTDHTATWTGDDLLV
jgi:N-acetylneuraminic acid mutarotase